MRLAVNYITATGLSEWMSLFKFCLIFKKYIYVFVANKTFDGFNPISALFNLYKSYNVIIIIKCIIKYRVSW